MKKTANYLKKIRKGLLPWVIDWTDPQDQIRKEYDVNKLKWQDWFWCHPTAYQLVWFGTPSCGLVISFILFVIASFKQSMFIYAIAVIYGVLNLYLFARKSWQFKHNPALKDYTFYDYYLRDYEAYEVVSNGKEEREKAFQEGKDLQKREREKG